MSAVDMPSPELVRPRLVRIVFVLALIGFPFQMYVEERLGEPYPGLFQPSFSGSPLRDGVLRGEQPVVTIEFEDGSREPVDVQDIMPATRLNSDTVFRYAFHDSRLANDPETVVWLRELVETAFPQRQATRMVVAWERVKRVEADSWRPTRSAGKTITVPLGS